jgi:hypothetical protein
MQLDFVNREPELIELDQAAAHGGLVVVFGRRRVGKTRLLRHWLDRRNGLYSQAIEAPRELQIQQVFEDLQAALTTTIVPKTWPEFLEILALQKKPWRLCLDEFPYMTAVDATLPSQMQKWLDHSLPSGCLVILSGSSTRMMNAAFLNRSAPLYGRARKLLQIRPMDYRAFCEACRLDAAYPESFEKFACVGGIPKYWEFVEPRQGVVALCEELYFGFAPYMEQEPLRILRDEGIAGLNALAVLEAVGRGAERPSEVAARMGTAQTNLSRLLQQLMDASILTREIPYGESTRSTKKIFYRIADPTLRFWFRVYSPHRSRWATYTRPQKKKLIHDHAASVFEDFCHARYPGAARYWEGNMELDLVAPDPLKAERLLVAEVKFRRLPAAGKARLLRKIEATWAASELGRRQSNVRFEIIDQGILGQSARVK